MVMTRKQKLAARIGLKSRRNDALFDGWSVIHCLSGVAFGWIMNPFIAMIILVLWEPLEIFILSPIIARFGYEFGYESLRNSLSDIVFDTIGVIVGTWLLASAIDPPFYLF